MARVAIVDLDPDFQELVRELLVEQGWDVLPCPDEHSVLAVLQVWHPDVMLLDLWLAAPENGWKLLQQVLENPVTQAIPIVICSADVPSLHAHAAWLAQHQIPVVEKPFDLCDLERTLHQAAARSRQCVAG